jgi:threonine/homoserine/homoserine lactone efflux protein
VRADLLAGALAGLAVAMPIGAIGSYLVGLAARERFAVAAAAALGVATTDGLYALVAGLGIGGLERAIGSVAGPLQWLAAALLVGLAVRTLVLALRRTRADGSSSSSADRLGTTTAGDPDWPTGARGKAWRTYAVLVGLTAVNPATIATFGAIVVGHQLAGSPVWLAALVFGVGAFVASGAWQLTLVSAGTVLGRALSGPHGQLVVASVSAAVMLVLAVVTVLR